MPEQLFQRVKMVAAERKTTFRALVIEGLERVLGEKPVPFTLRDASVGSLQLGETAVDSRAINDAIEAQRESRFTP